MKTLKDIYTKWQEAEADNRRAESFTLLELARKIDGNEALIWMKSALREYDSMYFVASLFLKKPVPKKLVDDMVFTALTRCDASRCNYFLKPCIETYGHEKIRQLVLNHENDAAVIENQGVKKAFYWLQARVDTTRGKEA